MNKTQRFADKVLAVTGAAGDIGLKTAQYLVAEGASAALIDIDGAKLARAAESFPGGGIKAYPCDLRDPTAVEALIEAVMADFGRIDLAFNNAGLQGEFKPVHEYPADDFEAVIRVNVLGAFNFLRGVSRVMVKRRRGSIVNTASMAGVGGPPNMAAYGASKFAVVGLTQTAAKDLAPYGVRVNAISPAFMGPGFMWDRQVKLQAEAGSQYYDSNPEMTARQMIDAVPMRRCGDISEIPGTVAFLLSDEASYITGVNIPIAGGIL